ncbi:hypothetical protein RD792_012747 [Penstemon davidsonii]|uniref:Vernalization insensitive 3 n=1 Tax=Penstemon davidsonii TaxID=160366 RepID=A0ABR0CZ88_9LAMI|nr:hypothetical protein RD792_012747 [Penstemon davidsonii]
MVYDPSKCSKLSMEQKRDLVYEVSKWPEGATEMLQSWSRPEILQILCAELGKERKYTGLTKSKMIEHLLKIVHEKKSQGHGITNSSENSERTSKRQRKSDQPIAANIAALTIATDFDSGNVVYCKNSACKAKMDLKDLFCKRCACCICRKYDDNKDPSLWFVCNSEPPFHGPSCGNSCHLECALKHENSGISNDRQDKGLDGSFCCVSCGKVNDLLGSWRKQLVVARDTRRVDILCYRLCLGQKILAGTKHYQNLYGVIDEAVKKLEKDVGPLTGLPVKMARGIVNRLSSGPEIQRLCASAVESLELILSQRILDSPSDCNVLAAKLVTFEDIQASSLTVILNSDDSNVGNVVGYSLFHRKATDMDYLTEPTCRLYTPNTKFQLSGLTPATQYFLKVATFDRDRETGFCEFQFRTGNYQDEARNLDSKNVEIESSQSPATNYSSLSNPSSVEDETNNENRGDNYLAPVNLRGGTIKNSKQSQKETCLLDQEHSLKTKIDPLINDQMVEERTGLECVPYVDRSETGLPITPNKLENVKDSSVRNNRSEKDDEPQAGSSSKKRNGEIGDKDFKYYVKVIRGLECDGYLETTFRQKFLTWYSLRATSQEARIVKVFIDTFVEDAESLAEQLVDTFSDVVSNKRCSNVPAGFCSKLWH